MQIESVPATLERRTFLRGAATLGFSVTATFLIDMSLRRIGSERGIEGLMESARLRHIDRAPQLSPESVFDFVQQLQTFVPEPPTLELGDQSYASQLGPILEKLNTYFTPFISSRQEVQFTHFKTLPASPDVKNLSFIHAGKTLLIHERYLAKPVSIYFLYAQLAHELYHRKMGAFSSHNRSYNEISAQVVSAWVNARAAQDDIIHRYAFLSLLTDLAFGYLIHAGIEDTSLRPTFVNAYPFLAKKYATYDGQTTTEKQISSDFRNKYFVQPLDILIEHVRDSTHISPREVLIPSGNSLDISPLLSIFQEEHIQLPDLRKTAARNRLDVTGFWSRRLRTSRS